MHDPVCILLDVIPFDHFDSLQRQTSEAVSYDVLHYQADHIILQMLGILPLCGLGVPMCVSYMQAPMGLAGMPGGGMQQAQQFPQRQPMMQAHQIQPGQQGYPIAYQNAG